MENNNISLFFFFFRLKMDAISAFQEGSVRTCCLAGRFEINTNRTWRAVVTNIGVIRISQIEIIGLFLQREEVLIHCSGEK